LGVAAYLSPLAPAFNVRGRMTNARLYNNVNANGYNSFELLLAQLHKSFQPKCLDAIEQQFFDMAVTKVWLLEVSHVCFKETPPMAKIYVLICYPMKMRMNSGTPKSSKSAFYITAGGTQIYQGFQRRTIALV
jgi:hypothetical protein